MSFGLSPYLLTGSFLDNDCFSPFKHGWLEQVDKGLTALGITAVRVESFDYLDLPDPLPFTDTPGCGEWTPPQIAQALKQFEATEAAGHAPPLEPHVVEAVTQCAGWMQRAAERPGFGVIAFRT